MKNLIIPSAFIVLLETVFTTYTPSNAMRNLSVHLEDGILYSKTPPFKQFKQETNKFLSKIPPYKAHYVLSPNRNADIAVKSSPLLSQNFKTTPFSRLSDHSHSTGVFNQVRYFAVRKSVRDLTDEEKQKYVNGVKALKNEKDSTWGNTYDKYVKIHANMRNMHNAHWGPAFLPWHRKFILDFEADLQRILKDSTFGLPYWDWEWDASQPNPKKTPVWKENFMGGEGMPVTTGPFREKQWTIINTLGNTGSLERAFGSGAPTLPKQQDIDYALSFDVYDEDPWNTGSKKGFRNTLEGFLLNPNSDNVGSGLHGRVHVWVGGHMGDVPVAVNDPVFFLHHSNVDRIWAKWQNKYPKELNPRETTYPKNSSHPGHNLNDPMAPWNPPMKTLVSPADVLNYRALGYHYRLGGEAWESPKIAKTDCYSPALAAFDNYVYMTFKSTSDENQLCVARTKDGKKWENPMGNGSSSAIPHQRSSRAPALAGFNDYLYMTYTDATGDENQLYVTRTKDGKKWENPITGNRPIPHQRSSNTPALAKFNDYLYMTYTDATGDKNQLYVTRTRDGINWENPMGNGPIPHQRSSSGPALAKFNDHLYMAYTDATGDKNQLYLTRTKDGKDWENPMGRGPIPHQRSSNTPALTSLNGYLYMVYKDHNHTDSWVIRTPNGKDWENPRGGTSIGYKNLNGALALTNLNNDSLLMAYETAGNKQKSDVIHTIRSFE